MTLTIKRYDMLNGSPAIALAMQGWLEMDKQGRQEQIASIRWDHKAIVAFEAETPVGAITWTHQKWMSAVYAVEVYVLPPWRRLGVFTAMWNDLLEQACGISGVASIRLGLHPDNQSAREIYERAGGKQFAVFYKFTLPEDVRAP